MKSTAHQARHINRFWGRLACVLLIGMVIPWGDPAHAQQPSGVRLTATAGFDGYCKDFQWLPLKISLENSGPDVEGRLEARLPNLFGTDTLFTTPISLPGPSRKEFFLYVYPEAGFLSQFPLVLIADGKTVVQTLVNITCGQREDRFFGVLASDPSAFNLLADLDPDPPGHAVVAHLDIDSLPDTFAGLQAMEVILVSGVDTSVLVPSQLEALSAWVASGGELIVAGGADWRKTAAGLGNLLPLQPDGATTVDHLDSLAAFVSGAPGLQGNTIVATGKVAEKAKILVREGNLPVIVSQAWGYGRVIYLAADPAQEPLKSWTGLLGLYRRLLAGADDTPSFTHGFQDWGYAANALGALGNRGIPPSWLVIGLLFAYVVAIGPANYLLLRVFHRRELAWVTIPAVVMIFSGLAFGLGRQSRGNQPVIQRLAIVQAFPGVPHARVDALVGIFSPSRRAYQVKLGPGFLAHPIPEHISLSTVGGWEIEQNGSLGTTLPDVRTEVGGMKAVAMEGVVAAPAIQSDLRLDLNAEEPVLAGSVTNQSDLTLEDSVLIAPFGRQPVGTLTPGTTTEVNLLARAAASNLSGFNNDKIQVVPPDMPFGPFGYNDPFLVDLLGTSDFYSDNETYRRFSLAGATIPFSQVSNAYLSGVILAGWMHTSPVEAEVENQKAETQDTTLYIITLPFDVQAPSGELSFPPALFSWSSLYIEKDLFASPYNLTLHRSDFSFRYDLAVPVDFSEIVALTLHLIGEEPSGPVSFDVYIWDFDGEQWVRLFSPVWGDNSISDARRYVSTNGELRLWLDGGALEKPVFVKAADFTLVVRP